MNIKQDRPFKKLLDKRIGPYKIIEKIGEAAFIVIFINNDILD
jgi:hypothetical protein